MAAVLSAQVILICRLYAVYQRNNKLLVVLALSLALGLCATLVYTSLEKLATNCISMVTAKKYWFGLLLTLIDDTILCSLMIFKAIQNYRDRHRSPLLSKMIHDSVIYFVGIFVAISVNTVCYLLKYEDWAGMAIVWESTIPCIMGCRLLANIMEYADVSNSCPDTTGLPIDFYHSDRLSVHQSGVDITP